MAGIHRLRPEHNKKLDQTIHNANLTSGASQAFHSSTIYEI